MAINIKKIKSLKAFCGLDEVEGDNFKDYNVIFGNNGCGKTSLTRAFELLIPKNNHIEKYRTISSSELPNIEFEFENGSYTIEPNSNNDNIPFKVEIYNSDFLYHNAPFAKEKEEKIQNDFEGAINYGNRVRILLESFLKINFIEFSKFKHDELLKIFSKVKKHAGFDFSKTIFYPYKIENMNMLIERILKITKGLHEESHGSVSDLFNPSKVSLKEVQGFAKIAINAMRILSPHQISYYIGFVDNENKKKNL